MAFALSSTFCVSRVVARPLAKRSTAARRAASATPARAVLDDSVDSAPAPSVSRRDAIALPTALAAAAAFSTSSASARGLPELECAGELKTAASGLQFCEAVVGSGREPTKGTVIKAHYTGRLTDGRVFDSSYTRGSPLQFKVGVGQVIKGWDEGILGGEGIPPMKVGGKRVLVIPANLSVRAAIEAREEDSSRRSDAQVRRRTRGRSVRKRRRAPRR